MTPETEVLENDPSRRLDEAVNDTKSFLFTVYINLFIWGLLIIAFEIVRNLKQVYLKRIRRKFEATQRVPERPPRRFLGWIKHVYVIPGEDFLTMVGLDGYVFLRFIALCFKLSLFVTFWGCVVLVPIYGKSRGGLGLWNKYTLANVVDSNADDWGKKLWLPALFSYVFVVYACHLLYMEYHHFVLKRLEYLIEGDPDTAPQTHYTVMLENVPTELQSSSQLHAFFEKLFPGQIYSAEVMLDLSLLETLGDQRRETRNRLEKAIAVWNATGCRPTVSVTRSFYNDMLEDRRVAQKRLTPSGGSEVSSGNGNGISPITERPTLTTLDDAEAGDATAENPTLPPMPLPHGAATAEVTHDCCGFIALDAIDHYTYLLARENETVRTLQEQFMRSTQETEAKQAERLQRTHPESRVSNLIEFIQHRTTEKTQMAKKNLTDRIKAPFMKSNGPADRADMTPIHSPEQCPQNTDGASSGSETSSPVHSGIARADAPPEDDDDDTPRSGRTVGAKVLVAGRRMFEDAASVAGTSLNALADESVRTARVAGKGAVRGLLEATRTLELLTLGAYYSTSSTAFVTFSSRVAKSVSYQMLLSHEFYKMSVAPAPNTKDIIWTNVHTPQSQVEARRQIAGMVFGIMAIFWSVVVASINAYSNLDSLAQDYNWLQQYQNSIIYKLLNQYLAVVILLILLAVLPFIFDFVARFYEGLKCESEIQDLIMTRYFYYQLANVYVTVTTGTIIGGINEIISRPQSILTILGESLPQVSIYFANLLVVKTLTAVPIEMLRIWPLLTVLGFKTCVDKKKCTRRELRTGVFEDYQMEYGWLYPSLLMVLMILTTYMCIAPLLSPCAVAYFASAYIMYKYQMLYVFVNEYQSGGKMWYQVFNRSMIILVCGSLVLLGYLGLKKAFYSGPFYLMFPQPFLLLYFWKWCNEKFKIPSFAMSLEGAVELDGIDREMHRLHKQTVAECFSPTLFRQPSLTENELKPEKYRNPQRKVAVPADDLETGVAVLEGRDTNDIVDVSIEESKLYEPGDPFADPSVPSVQSRRSSLKRMPSLEEIDDDLVEDQIDEMLGTSGVAAEDSPILVELSDRRSTTYGTMDHRRRNESKGRDRTHSM